MDPAWFVAEQIPQKHPVVITENSLVLAWQLGNLYLLMAFVGLGVLMTSSEIKVVRAYLFALWLGDIGHVGFTCYGLGMNRLMDPSAWNGMTIGNVAFTVSQIFHCYGASYSCCFTQIFLFTSRSAYFLGLFGSGRPAVTASKKRS